MASPLPLDSAPPGGSPPRRPTLLIVDDEEGPRLALKRLFADGYELLSANDGPSALELADTHRVDVAVLDIRMGAMTGIELLQRLRLIDPSVEAVMMTAFETTDTMRDAWRLRACDYINKPFDSETMRAAVAQAMERRSLSADLRINAEQLDRLNTDIQQARLDGEIARSRGEIYGSIIHDINGPLTIMSGLLELINQRLHGRTTLAAEDVEQMQDRLKRITRQVTNCIEISRRYLSFLRKNPEEKLTVWVNQVLGDLRELLRVHPENKNAQLLIHPLPEDVMASINGTDLIQILKNLAVNGLQATPQFHRVEIVCQLIEHPLDLDQFRDGPEDRFINREGFQNTAPLLAISVQDNGPGIPSEIMPKLFEPYFTRSREGTGLGLCIVERLIKEASGAVHGHTQVGQGTIFTVYIPACVAPPNATFPLVAN